MTYRNEVDALAARHAALEAELSRKIEELCEASSLLEEARAKQRLPVLDNLRVASPCSASWDRMAGDDRVRHCGDCKKDVFNVSNMTRDEAEALIASKHGNLCVRYYQRADGTILLSDCTISAGKTRKRRLVAAGVASLLAGGGVAAYELSRSEPDHVIAIQGQIEATRSIPNHVTHVTPDGHVVTELMGAYQAPPVPPPEPHTSHTAPKPTHTKRHR